MRVRRVKVLLSGKSCITESQEGLLTSHREFKVSMSFETFPSSGECCSESHEDGCFKCGPKASVPSNEEHDVRVTDFE
jgi:hypothetical protein